MSFADLAKTASPMGFGGGFISQANPFSSIVKGQAPPPMLFGQKTKTGGGGDEDGEEGGEGNPEDYEPEVFYYIKIKGQFSLSLKKFMTKKVEFKPLVKLAEVEVRTGEEEEEIMFKSRCKLYRFDTSLKEWKEKGVGEMKILKHKTKANSYRVLMRRDQVLKLCANHRISADIKLEFMNEKQLRWLANDCSEGGPSTELLAVKFRHEEDAKSFHENFTKAQQNAATTATPTKSAPTQNNGKN